MLPTFFVIGAQKAATTTIWELLRQHPEVFLPEIKETNFLFHGPGNWDKGRAWYEALYEPAGDAIHRGDVSPGYSMFPFFPDPPARAASLVADARVIYTIRHPVERMVSAWAQSVEDGFEDRDLETSVLERSNYFLPSCYGLQLSRWAAIFPPEALLVIRSEDLATKPGPTIDRILSHLGIATGWRPPDPATRLNRSEEKRIPSRPVRRVTAVLRGAGLPRAATWIAKHKKWARRARLVRDMQPNELTLDPELAAALLECFRSDFGLLRAQVGPHLDLYGLA